MNAPKSDVEAEKRFQILRIFTETNNSEEPNHISSVKWYFLGIRSKQDSQESWLHGAPTISCPDLKYETWRVRVKRCNYEEIQSAAARTCAYVDVDWAINLLKINHPVATNR